MKCLLAACTAVAATVVVMLVLEDKRESQRWRYVSNRSIWED